MKFLPTSHKVSSAHPALVNAGRTITSSAKEKKNFRTSRYNRDDFNLICGNSNSHLNNTKATHFSRNSALVTPHNRQTYHKHDLFLVGTSSDENVGLDTLLDTTGDK